VAKVSDTKTAEKLLPILQQACENYPLKHL